jgi:hypothetical protein
VFGDIVGDPRSGNVARLGEVVQPVRARIEIVVLELIGRGMSTGSV